MHGSLIDSHHRSSLSGSGHDGILSSSEHTLTDDELMNKPSTDVDPSGTSASIHSQKTTRSIDDTNNNHKTSPMSTTADSGDFFRWTRGHRHVMLTFCTICLFGFMTGVEYAVILPTAFDYVKTMANANIYVGLILSAYSISGSITGIIMGKISDVTGKVKFLILISSLFEIAGNILYFAGGNIQLVLLGRLVAGVGMGAVPPILADVAHRTTEHERTKAISIILGCRQLGLLIGPCFTLLIRLMNFHIGSVRVYNLNGPGFLMAIIWLILVIVCWSCFHDRTTGPNSQNTSHKDKFSKSDHYSRQDEQKISFKTYREQYIRIEMIVLFVATFITYFNQTALETIVAAYTEKHFKWTVVHTSILFAFAGLEILLVYLALVKIFTKRYEDRILLVFGFLSLSLACIVGTFLTWGTHSFNLFSRTSANGVNTNLLALFITFVILDLLGLPFIAATSVSLFTKLTNKQLQGFSQGIQRSIMGIGTIVGPIFASSLLNRLHIMMTAMLILTLFTSISILIVIRRLLPLAEQTQTDGLEDINNNIHNHHILSSKTDNNQSELGLILPSKNSYTTLIQHDDDDVFLRTKSQSNGDRQHRTSNHQNKI
ncbi:unnamed protein product [Adineta ricciae]|uniref:Major facilitator superfamily (MFS) profile domain-containing protein n=2 Tax=Adineta ricciae TaxID=249248 RepID=A0A814YV06_ADIRI|nr:unnamed protein product [Adineta ricciae]